MKNFYRNSTYLLLVILSFFAGVGGKFPKTFHWTTYSPMTSLQAFLILSGVLVIVALPEVLFEILQRKIGK